MKRKYNTYFGNYLPLLRSSLYLLTTKKLTLTQFGVYICLVTQAKFGRKLSDYSAIIRDDSEIAKSLSLDPSTIYRNRIELIKKGLLVEKNGITYVPNYYMFEYEFVIKIRKLPNEILQDLFVNPQDDFAGIQKLIADLQDIKHENISSFNLSSKSDLTLSEEDKQFIDDTLSDTE